MKNNVLESILSAKQKIKAIASDIGDVPCKYKQSGRVMSGHIIPYINRHDVSVYDLPSINVRVRSSTKSEYYILLTDIVDIAGISKL